MAAPAPEPEVITSAEAEIVERAEAPAAKAGEPQPTEIPVAEAPVVEPAVTEAPSSTVEAQAPEPTPEPPAAEGPPAPVVTTKPEPSPAPSESREAPQPRQAERAREVPQDAKPKQRPMTLGVAKQPARPASPLGARSYAGKVHAAIARHRRGSKGGSGSATVTFSIGPAGGLRSASISRSSGRRELDQAALASVRSAAPFPPPPPGAKSTYSIKIYFR
jgi:protein TonB